MEEARRATDQPRETNPGLGQEGKHISLIPRGYPDFRVLFSFWPLIFIRKKRDRCLKIILPPQTFSPLLLSSTRQVLLEENVSPPSDVEVSRGLLGEHTQKLATLDAKAGSAPPLLEERRRSTAATEVEEAGGGCS